jgi:hypothetical protein
VRLLSTTFFFEGLCGIAHLTDLSPLVSSHPQGSTPRRRPPMSWAHRRELGPDLLLLLSSTHVELQRRRVELMRHVEELLLFCPDRVPPPNVIAPPLLARRSSTSRDGVSGPRFRTPRILLSTLSPPSSPAGDREHHSGERAPPHAAVCQRMPVSHQAGPRWAVRTEQASRAVS